MTIPEMDLVSQTPAYSDDPETKGFDLSAAKLWIYPENYPLRDYQYNIVETALYNNTLVCLPTGLGKTFIAAVVMYNYWRWYPCGKMIFLAPTRPLVAQQIAACHNVMGIPLSETIELTGSTNKKERKNHWSQKRVIFATPHIFQNDLMNNIVPSALIKIVVIDEAHKALGKHSYCECIRMLSMQNLYYRVLALSATPGNKMDKVHEVVQNLHISQIELRDETSHDIKPYVNERKLDVILVPLSKELADFKERYLNIMDPHVKYLYQSKILPAQTANITKGRIFYIIQDLKKSSHKPNNYGHVMNRLNILLTMYHAYELMVRHGLRAFIKFYENHSDKTWMNSAHELQSLLDDVHAYLGPFPNVQMLPNGEIPEVPKDIKFGHNKFYKLNEVLIEHFKRANENQDTRAIVFVEYKDIVNEVYVLLLQLRPLIRPQMFVGQSGQKQRQQKKALEDFRKNVVNVLISTSIGEEGLDVGEVDLIICFDTSQQSPTRLVQRMGRTGRKRDGHIIVLVTVGKEHEIFKSTIRKRDSLNDKILHTSNITSSLYEHNPRMVPEQFTPECHKRIIVVQQESVEIRKRGQKKVKPKKIQGQPTLQKHFTNAKKIQDNEIRPNDTQPSVSKFLENTDPSVPPHEDNNIYTLLAAQTRVKIRNIIKPSNVKLLSCDSDACDFLTLCAIKKSEKEAHQEVSKKIDTRFIPSPCSNEEGGIFDFSVPDTKILDTLSFLNKDIIIKLYDENQTADTNDNSDNDMYDMNEPVWCNPYENFASSVNDCSLNPANEIAHEPLMESRFEDLLDETSNSDVTVADLDRNHKSDIVEKCPEVSNDQLSNADWTLDHMDLEAFDETLHDMPASNKGFTTESAQKPPLMGHEDKNTSIYEDLFVDTDEESDGTVPAGHKAISERKNQDEHFDSVIRNNSSNPLHERTATTQNEKSSSCLPEFINDMDLPETCKPRVTDANKINSLIQQHFSKTSSLRNEFTSSSEKLDLTANAESEDDMFAMDFDAIEKQIVVVEKQFAEDKSQNDVICLDNSYDDNAINTKKITSPIDSKLVKDNDCKDVQNENSDFEDFEWKSDFELPSPPAVNIKKSNYSNEQSTSSISSKTNVESPIVKLDMKKANDNSKSISRKESSLSAHNRCKLAKKLSKLRKSATSNVQSTSNSWFDSDTDDFANDFALSNNDFKKITELESSFFTVNNEFHEKVNKASTSSTPKKDLSVFKAPNKYLKTNHGSPSPFKNWEQNQNNLSLGSAKAPSRIHRTNDSKTVHSKKKRRNKRKLNFVEDEAEVSGEASTDENSESDEDLKDFVSNTQHIHDEVDMQAHYLQTIKSPLKKFGAFVIKKPQSPDHDIDIYSQPLSQEYDTYLHDSFCVEGDNETFGETKQNFGYTILEEAERALKKRRKRKNSEEPKDNSDNRSKKRMKVKLLNTSVSSEDEMERLRNEVQNESVMLKNVSPSTL